MKRTVFRTISLMLTIAMLCSVMLGTAAFAAEKKDGNSGYEFPEETISVGVSMATGKDEWGTNYFETFADLKKLVSKSYKEYTYYYYAGSEELVITEPLTIPKNLEIYADEMRIPQGVTVTVNGLLGSAYFQIQGSVLNNGMLFTVDSMIITGNVTNKMVVRMVETGMGCELIGEDKIQHVDDAWIECTNKVTDTDSFKKAIETAVKKPKWYHYVNVFDVAAAHIALNSSVAMPENVMVTNDVPMTITMNPGCTLYSASIWTVNSNLTIQGELNVQENGYFYIHQPAVFNGNVINNGILDVYPQHGGTLAINGNYVEKEKGWIAIDDNGSEIPSWVITGLNAYDFAYQKVHDDDLHYWAVDGYFNSDVELKPGQTVPMFRMYDPNSSEHFYTGSTQERFNLLKAGWNYEGVGFNFPAAGDPVHRLYHEPTGEHLYTMNTEEKNMLVGAGWKLEGTAFNSDPSKAVPQYRLHNPNATRGAYHFTGSTEEKQNLIAAGWEDQGIGWYSCLK